MIRSSKTTLKFARDGKLSQLATFIDEYRNVVDKFVTLLWDEKKIPSLLPKKFTDKANTWLSARLVQCAGKQASAIVRGTQKKQKSRLWVIDKLTQEGKHKQARKLQKIHDETTITKPDINMINPELDSRFVKVDLDNSTTFDGWLEIGSIGNRMKLVLPFKKTKHFNKLLKNGKIKGGVRISKESVTFMFELPDVSKVNVGAILGIDIGQKTVISCSNGFTSKVNSQGHDLSSITKIMSRKRKGSKAFARCSNHRTNYINWTIN
jgi:transposase